MVNQRKTTLYVNCNRVRPHYINVGIYCLSVAKKYEFSEYERNFTEDLAAGN